MPRLKSWRLDPQNGGVPYDLAEFNRVVERVHSYGIRFAVYIRGNEMSVTEGDCYWFDNLLHKDFDGLYMDYGSPFCELSSGDEMFPGDRMHLRRHYLKLRSLRKRVGNDGILISHTGPVFSAIGMTGGVSRIQHLPNDPFPGSDGTIPAYSPWGAVFHFVTGSSEGTRHQRPTFTSPVQAVGSSEG